MALAGMLHLLGCTRYEYTGSINLTQHPWMKGRKIFLDPGHGGQGKKDRFRQGPGEITEESINLTVGLILADMLKKSGAKVKLSRTRDRDVSLDDRVVMAEEFKPDILLGVHHNGTCRRKDTVNYPSVLIWGSREIKPASYDLADILLDEFHQIMDERGSVISDFSVFHETGTRILRKTAQLCPGVIGEGGFFSDETHAKRLSDRLYLELEAEAYFKAISRYFNWGLPDAEIILSCDILNNGILVNELSENNPEIIIRTFSGNENPGINQRSMKITLDGINVPFKKISDSEFLINYGKKLYPGGHALRFSFRNLRGQSSMILRAGFTVPIDRGDRDNLVARGKKLITKRKTAREGLNMLLAALSMSQTDPEAGKIISSIISGFKIIGDRGNAFYYEQKLVHFYPQSSEAKKITKRVLNNYSYRFPAEFYGKNVKMLDKNAVKDAH